MSSLSSASIGLSILSGGTVTVAATTVESRAARTARAAFTTPEATPPWKAKTIDSVELSKVKAMKTIVDKPERGVAKPLDADVQTSFTTYKALDRLRLLAEAAAKETTGSAERAKLEAVFARGLADLETYLGSAPSVLVDLSFGRAARQAQSVAVAAPSSLSVATIAGAAVVDSRTTPVPGLTGTERLRIDLSAPGSSDSVTVDLAAGTQPPTLDSVAAQINAAIAAVPKRDAAGDPVLDADGNAVASYAVTVSATKTGEKWGLSIARAGFETIAIDQIGAGDAVLVANGASDDGKPATAQVTRFDDPAGALTRRTATGFAATDAAATERLKLAADADATKKIKAATVGAAIAVRGVATDAQGFSYVVGTTAGDLGSNLSDGSDDLFLTKLDSEGKTVWRRTLGNSGSATGAAVAIAPDGGIVVAGTVTGGFDGATTDGDLLVARYDARGEETFATVVRAVGVDTAGAVAVGADGTIYVGGATAAGGGDAVLARFDAAGKLAERRVIAGAGAGKVTALAIAGDGALLALTGEAGTAVLRRIDATGLTQDLATLALGSADARAIAVGADGGIVVAGATDGDLAGTAVNTRSAGRDAFVARVDAALAGSAVTYLGSASEDQADSVAVLDGRIYVGGRTAGALDGAKAGPTDGFVARIDAGTGAIADIRQFGTTGVRTAAVQLTAIRGGDSVLGALGLRRGTLTPTDAVTLPAQTSLRVGDEFAIRVNNGAIRRITIVQGETLTTLANRVRTLIGAKAATVSTASTGGGRALRIDLKAGNEIELIAGRAGKDALAGLGLDARRIASPAALADDAPKVRPGGSYALDLTSALRIDTKSDAATALARVKQAISTSQSAYRSLYWDDTKAKLADAPSTSGRKGGSTMVQQAQLANYQAALTRLTDGSTSSYGF